MSKLLEVSSISEIPPVKSLRGICYVSLPVVLLAVCQLRVGVLLVTDFTEHPDSGFAQGKSAKSLPNQFFFRNKQLEATKVIAIGIPTQRLASLWNKLEAMVPALSNFDYRDEERCNISQYGVVVNLNFRISEYQGTLEGFVGQYWICNHEYMASDMGGVSVINKFVERYAKNMSCSLYDSVSKFFPIDKFVSRNAVELLNRADDPRIRGAYRRGYEANRDEHSHVDQFQRTASTKLRLTREASGIKVRRLDPSEAVFQQQNSFVSENRQTSHSPRESQFLHEAQPQKPNDDMAFPMSDQREDNTCRRYDRAWTLSTVNVIGFGDFTKISIHKVANGTCFETKALIKKISPNESKIFVKPYGRTLKAAPFRMVLASGNVSCILELHTEEEACKFFGIDEIEVAINQIDKLTSMMRSLIDHPCHIRIEKREMSLHGGQKRPYWCIVSALESLVS